MVTLYGFVHQTLHFPASRASGEGEERERRLPARGASFKLLLTTFLVKTYWFSKPVSFNVESVCPNCTLEIFEPTVVIVKTGSLSCVACDKDISGC